MLGGRRRSRDRSASSRAAARDSSAHPASARLGLVPSSGRSRARSHRAHPARHCPIDAGRRHRLDAARPLLVPTTEIRRSRRVTEDAGRSIRQPQSSHRPASSARHRLDAEPTRRSADKWPREPVSGPSSRAANERWRSPSSRRAGDLADDALAPGVYTVRWTTASAEDGDIDRGTTTFTVAARRRRRPRADARRADAHRRRPSRRRRRRRRAVGRLGAVAVGAARRRPAASTNDAVIPIIVALIVLAGLGLWLLRGRAARSLNAPRCRVRRVARAVAPVVGGLSLAGPATVLAHSLSNTYQSRLPLIVYLAGAAIAVGLSFAFLLIADVRADPPVTTTGPGPAGAAPLPAPGDRPDRLALDRRPGHRRRDGAGDVTTLFLWVYGWVGLAMLSAFVGPVWHWLDPFTTIHDIGAARAPRGSASGAGRSPSTRAALGRWPAVVGLVVLRLARARRQRRRARARCSSSCRLHRVHAGDDGPVRARRLAARTARRSASGSGCSAGSRRSALVGDPAEGRVARRPFASGLLLPGWRLEDLDPRRARDRVDPVRRPVPDPALVRGLRRAGRPDQDAPARSGSSG